MHNPHVRNWIIFLVVFWFVVSVKSELTNALFSVWIGIWVMARSFKFIFKSVLDSEYFTWDKYIFNRDVLFDLFSAETRKQTILILMWWFIGVVVAIASYKLLEALLISS